MATGYNLNAKCSASHFVASLLLFRNAKAIFDDFPCVQDASVTASKHHLMTYVKDIGS